MARGKTPSILFILGSFFEFAGIVTIAARLLPTLWGVALLVVGVPLQAVAFVVARRSPSGVATGSEGSD